jgi:hypothetical protein
MGNKRQMKDEQEHQVKKKGKAIPVTGHEGP